MRADQTLNTKLCVAATNFLALLFLQLQKITREEDLRQELQQLKETFDSMEAFEDEIFD